MASLGASKGVWLTIGGSLLGLLACGTTTPSAEVRSDGRLRVLPTEFTAEVGCSFASGDDSGLAYYVATIVDLGPAPDDDTSGSPVDAAGYPRLSGNGPVARCTSSTSFSTAADDSLIAFGHLYVSLIDGYPAGTSPVLRGDRNEGWPAPGWQWLCGVGGLEESELRWLVEQVNLLPRTAGPTTIRDAGANTSVDPAPDAETSAVDSGDVPDAGNAPDSGDVADAGNAPDSGAASADAGSESLVRDSGTAPVTDAAPPPKTTWDALMEAAALDAFPTPAKVVSGTQAGIRGCIAIH